MSQPTCAGGFIWALLDDGLKRPDTGEIDTAGNQAPDGIVGPYRQREGSYYAIKEIWSPIQVTHQSGPDFTIENHFAFTDTSQCRFTWQYREYEFPLKPGIAPRVILKKEGIVPSPRISAGGKGYLRLPDDVWFPGLDGVLSLRVNDSQGRELWTWTWQWPPNIPPRHSIRSNGPRGTVTESTDEVELRSGDLVVEISRKTGFLIGVHRNGQKFSLSGGPRPAAGTAQLTQMEIDPIQIAATFSGPLNKVAWHLDDGWLHCDYTYTAEGTNDYLGVLFDYPENLVKHKRWLGDGPYRVWQNRLRGVTLGVWENDYNNTLTGWRDWVYPEFKGFFANVRWLQLDTTEGPITVVNNSSVPFVQVLTPEFPPMNLVGKAFAPVPQCGLGFLDAIPPIGSKFKEARFGGPQGQSNMAHGEYSGAVSFYFGKLP